MEHALDLLDSLQDHQIHQLNTPTQDNKVDCGICKQTHTRYCCPTFSKLGLTDNECKSAIIAIMKLRRQARLKEASINQLNTSSVAPDPYTPEDLLDFQMGGWEY